jgi:gamma-glutamyltranspeptidase
VRVEAANYGGYQAVARTPSGWAGASEKRKDGMASGF